MKISTLIGAAIISFSATALAAYDMTYLTNAKAGETKELPVAIPSGKSTVEVWGEDNGLISCTFIDKGTGNVAYEAKHVTRCVGRADLTLPAIVQAKITNEESKDIRFRIWVRSTK